MATTLTTNNPNGLGYQTGYFSGPVGAPLDMTFFNAAFAGRINNNKIYKEAYHCNLVEECNMGTWMEEMMGYEVDCFPAYTLLETYGQKHLVKVETTVVIAEYPTTTAVHLDDSYGSFVSGAYILPQVGNTLVGTPTGKLIDVVSINMASSGDPIVTVRQRVGQTGTFTLTAGDELLVLAGSEISDCACPTGQFRVNDLPVEIDLSMKYWGDKGELCGDALDKCHFLKIPFFDECGNKVEHWYTQALKDMYKDHELRKYIERLLNPSWGIIPTIKARGMKWTPNSASEITTDDVRAWVALLDAAGISCREFAVFAGTRMYSQWQRMLLAAGVTQLDNTVHNPAKDCKWINMEYCGIKVEGLVLHIYKECAFSNGKVLGSGSSKFPDSAIIVPMCNRPQCRRSTGRLDAGGSDDRMLTTVYFKANDGTVLDNWTDSNGILGPRNTFRAGCRQHEWTIASRFLQEIHCASHWSYIGLT